MELPLLDTKLHIPRARTDRVHRPRLIARLSAGGPGQLSLISAPAGFGKTTLVSVWIHTSAGDADGETAPARVAWLALDEADNDPARFFTYLVAALQRVDPLIGQNVSGLLASAPSPPVEQIVTLLVYDVSQLAQPMVLVLDDYHHIRDPGIHAGLRLLLDQQPPNLQLVITTRRDPPLPLARLRVRGKLVEIRERHLRFTPEETARFFQQSGGLVLDDGTVQRLRDRTEGWVAGLQMAAISLMDNPDREGFVAQFTGSHRYVADYLMDEVLARQPEPVRQFLLRTTLLDRFNAGLCDAVTGRQDGKEMLEQIEQANLFLVPLDANRNWYRYHHLFRDFLRHRLLQGQPELPSEIYGRASHWFEQHGFVADAIEMALAADCHPRAADLIEGTADGTIWQQGQWPTLLRWLKGLPEELIAAHPRLCLYHAWGLMAAGEVDACEGRLADAERGLEPGAPAADAVLGQVAAVRATLARFRGDLGATVSYARHALELLPRSDRFWRASTALNLGAIYYVDDDVAAAEQALAEAQLAAEAAANVSYGVVATSHLAQLQVRQGRLHQAEQLYEGALERAQAQGGRLTFTTGMAHVGLGDLYREWNDLEAAARHLELGLDLGTRVNNLLILVSGHIAMARLKQAQGDTEAAVSHLQHAERCASAPGVTWTWLNVPVEADLARLWVGQSQLEPAKQIAQRWESAEAGRHPLPGYWAEGQALARTRLLAAQGHYANALPQLERLAQVAEENGRTGSLIEIYARQALLQSALEGQEAALITLDRALRLAAPGGYVRLFLDLGPALAELLRQLPPSPYRDRLLEHFDSMGPGEPDAVLATAPPQPLIDPLTERELQILRLMAARLSNREIGEELYLATTTIKWYSRQIYGKLGVNDRRAAVERACELNIL